MVTPVLYPSATGAAVGELHQRLLEAGYEIAVPELKASFYGKSTHDAVRAFQAHHVDQRGGALVEDGVIGAATWWALNHPGHKNGFVAAGWRCDPAQIRESVRPVVVAAIADVGIFEQPDGSNDGARVKKYANVIDGKAQPWCAYAVSYWYGRLSHGSPFGRIASAYKMLEWGKLHARVLGDGACAQAGDVFVILRANLRGHVGLVVNALPDGRVCAVEGNVSNAVRATVRARTGFSALVRPVPLV